MPSRPAVTFDLWHTLVYLEPEGEAAYLAGQFEAAIRVLERSAPLPGREPSSPGELRAAYDAELHRAVAESHAGRSVTPAEQITRAALSTGRTPDPAAFEAALGELVRTSAFRVADGAVATLRRLRELGFGVGIISNTVGEPGRFLKERLAADGFEPVVEVYTFSDEHPWAKPAAEIFRTTLQRLGSSADRAIHVGDGWADLAGARNAGLAAGVLFDGLQRYAPEYRALNYAPPIDRSLVDDEIHRLEDAIPIARRRLGPGA